MSVAIREAQRETDDAHVETVRTDDLAAIRRRGARACGARRRHDLADRDRDRARVLIDEFSKRFWSYPITWT